MPAVILILLKKDIELEKIKDMWRTLVRIKCSLGKKRCNSNCILCHRSLIIQRALYPDLQNINNDYKLFSIRTPYIIKLPQVYVISRIIYRKLSNKIEKIIVPSSIDRYFEIKNIKDRILIDGNAKENVEFKNDPSKFPPPYKIMIQAKQLSNLDITDLIGKEIRIRKTRNKIHVILSTQDPSKIAIRFKKMGPGIIQGNPRVYSKQQELFHKIISSAKGMS